MTPQAPEQTEISRLAGEVKEFLALQKNLGRKFLLWSKPKATLLETLEQQPGGPYDSPAALAQAVRQCRQCPLFSNRSQSVPGQGPGKARLMLVGNGPSEADDREGRPFSGPEGDLLTKMIQAIQISREEVFLTQAIKCRPPEDRRPQMKELDACGFYLKEEIRLVNPDILVALGDLPAQIFSRTNKTINELRGRWLNFEERPVMAMFHPAFLLTHPEAKREAWEDLKKIRQRYDELEPK